MNGDEERVWRWLGLVGAIGIAGLGCSGSPSSESPDDPPPDEDVVESATLEPGLCQRSQNLRPFPPQVTSPVSGRLDVSASELLVTASAFVDANSGDTHRASEFEIWKLTGRGGEAETRVWTARLEGAEDLTRASLADGVFDGLGDQVALVDWEDYGVRVRYQDGSADCPRFSAWSEFREFRTDDGSATLFNPSEIRDVFLTIPPASFAAIDAEARPPGCVPYQRNYYTGSIEFEGETFDGVGIRVKGGCGSARHLDQKAAFKVNLSWDDPAVEGCPEERRFRGLKRITLNNMVQDRSFLHETLAYNLHKRMGVPTPRVEHIRVHVNGELWGLYLQQEAIDRRFLDRWFGSRKGMLYEGTYWCDLIPANVPDDEDVLGCLSKKFSADECSPPDPELDPQTYDLIRELTTEIAALPPGGFYPAVEEFFNFDTFLSSWAVDTVAQHWDGYAFQIMNNYRVYHDPTTDRWTIIPTGMDQTFRDSGPALAVNAVLARRCMEEVDCAAAYRARLQQVLTVFEEADYGTLATQIRDRIAVDVAADPRTPHSASTIANAFTDLQSWIGSRPGIVRAQYGL